MTELSQWLELAPTPRELRPDQRWHVFLSYRSVNRPWVIQLYDVLRHLGFEVFLDQYVLTPSVQLVGGLEEGLEKSAAGVLVWSTAAADSKWCRKEYLTMEARSEDDDDFHYVVVKLDEGKLPLFADQRVYVDFSHFREGPRGSGLIRLLYGVQGEPLPDAAVRLAAEVDQEVREALTEIRGALDNGNHWKLVELAGSQGLAWLTTPVPGCQVVESLIRLKRYDDALDVLDALQLRFPKAVRPLQLRGLALARKGDWRHAQDVLDNLVAAGEQDPETLGIYARTWADRYDESGNPLHLERSRDLYARAFENAPDDYYTGINAASKSVLLGDLESAERYAAAVEPLVGTERVEGDYWKTASAAEVQLIRGHYADAAALYRAAVVMAPEELGSHESTWRQARRLMEKLAPDAADREKVAAAFAHLSST